MNQFEINGGIILSMQSCCVSTLGQVSPGVSGVSGVQDLLGEVREAGWDGAFTIDPEGLHKGDIQVLIMLIICSRLIDPSS